jgi:hypothetical protein
MFRLLIKLVLITNTIMILESSPNNLMIIDNKTDYYNSKNSLSEEIIICIEICYECFEKVRNN